MKEEKMMFNEINSYLQKYAVDEMAREHIAPFIAEKSLQMNHLYEDLGFKSRTQMGAYMAYHFPKLAQMKPKEKLWKKFLYDEIGRVAPACVSCKDQEHCFSCLISEASA